MTSLVTVKSEYQKMKKLSIVMPCETGRIPLLLESMKAYEKFGIPEDVEFIIVSRTIKPNQLSFKHTLVNYKWELTPDWFNPSLALNLGVKAAKHDNIIITCPEVRPDTDCLNQLKQLPRGNYVCMVWDLNEDGSKRRVLVSKTFRKEHPGFYFLALYRREDIDAINGWDLEFMDGFAWDDNDFGERFARADLPFEIRNDIRAEHQYHGRVESWGDDWTPKRLAFVRNRERTYRHTADNVTRIDSGLKEVEKWYNEKCKC